MAMRDRPNKFNDTPTLKDAWLDELEEYRFDDGDLETAAGGRRVGG